MTLCYNFERQAFLYLGPGQIEIVFLKDVRAHCYCAFFRACQAHVVHRRPPKQNRHGIELESEPRSGKGIAVDPGRLGNVTQGHASEKIQSL